MRAAAVKKDELPSSDFAPTRAEGGLDESFQHLIADVRKSPFGAQAVSAEAINQLSASAKRLGSRGTPILDAIAQLPSSRHGETTLSPADSAALLTALKSAADAVLLDCTEKDLLQRQIEAHAGLIRYLHVNQEAILRTQGARQRAFDIGGTAIATAGGSAIAAGIFGEKVAEEVATTLIEVGFGSGLVLLIRAGIRFIHATSENAATRRADASTVRVKDLVDKLSRGKAAMNDRITSPSKDLLASDHSNEWTISPRNHQGYGAEDGRAR